MVLLQRGVGAPVHDGVEVQVEDRLVAGGEPAGDHLLVQRGQEGALVVVAGAVGVVGECGLLRQRGQPGQQRGGRVGQQQVIDVGDAPGPGQFQGQQAQQPAGGGHHPGAGVAGRLDQGGQIQGDQVGYQQQQPGLGRVHPGRPGGEVQDRGAGQPGVAAGRSRRGGGLLGRVAQQPPEPFLGEDFPDAGAVERGGFGGQLRGDLVGRQALAAELDHPAADAVLGRGHPGRRSGFAGRGEQLKLPGPVVVHQVHHGPAGVAEALSGLGMGEPVDEERAQRLVTALVDLLRRGEELRPGALG